MEHICKGTLKLGALQTLVLDEADEMLRMGFIDDVEWILEQTPTERQMALFSATMLLFLDGVTVDSAGSSTRFRWVKAPASSALNQLSHTIAHRLGRYLERQGLW